MRKIIRPSMQEARGDYGRRNPGLLRRCAWRKKEEDALAFIEEMKKKYWDARHNCYAYSIENIGVY